MGDVPDPTGWLVTRWAHDPFALGSYSFLAVGSTPEDRARLAEPVDATLFFAGEATSTDFPSTVHGALLAGQRAAEQVIDQADPDPDTVVVVGAGVSGLASARVLRDQGYQVVVVEGRDRIGGRIWTDRRLGPPLDLGASWIHGTVDNPVAELADGWGIATVATDYDNVITFDADGIEVGAEEQAAVEELLEEVLDEAAAWAEAQDDDVPLARAVDQALQERSLTEADARRLAHALNTTIEQEYAADAAELSARWWDDDDELDGADVLFPDGYGQVVERLAEGLDVRLGHVVERVAWGGGGVTVITGRGPIQGDCAVITVPLGVLQAGRPDFDPPLPAAKQAAVERLGMGLLDKVYLRFPEVFWDAGADLLGYASDDRDEWGEFVNLAPVTGEPILLWFNAGTVARRFEQETDQQLVARAMRVLRAMYGS
ncbi:MAG: FAD-dependent oxidoreductase [Acidimicrobiales bacterium]|nr:FAD-dependent oxidoreductase [Acidimicrobiales bacterium]